MGGDDSAAHGTFFRGAPISGGGGSGDEQPGRSGSFLFGQRPSDPAGLSFREGYKASRDPDVGHVIRDLEEKKWTLRPLLTNPVGVTIFLSYVLLLGSIAYIYQAFMLSIDRIEVSYAAQPGCQKVSDITDLSARKTEDYECFEIPQQKGTAKTVVEKFVIDVDVELKGPLFVYYEVTGM